MWTRKGQLFVAGGAALVLAGVVLNAPFVLFAGFFPLTAVLLAALVRLKRDIERTSKKLSARKKAAKLGLKFERELSHASVVEGDEAEVTLKVTNTTALVKRLQVKDGVADRLRVTSGRNHKAVVLPPKGTVELKYKVWAPVKGVHDLGPITIRTSDIADIFFDELTVDENSSLMVHPGPVPTKGVSVKSKVPKLYSGSTIINRKGQGTEFYSLREYVVGDNYKDINWTAFAKTKRLMVNEHTMEAVVEVTMFLDYRAVSSIGPVMNAVDVVSARAATSIADAFLKRRDRVGIVVYNDSIHQLGCEGGMKHQRKIRDTVSGLSVKGDLGLGSVVNTLMHTIRKGTPVIIISSLEQDPTVLQGIKKLRALRCDVTVISPTAIPTELDKGARSEADLQKLQVIQQERDVAMAQATSLGAKVVDWDIRVPLAEVMVGGGPGGR